MTADAEGLSSALLYNPLTYADSTGELAVRHLAAGRIDVRWEDGSIISFEEPEARLIIKFIRAYYSFRLSRKGRLWATAKKNPGAAPTATGVRNESPTRS